jgi:hypothetical protein
MYKLEDEPLLKFSMLVAVDGNSSLKHVDSALKKGEDRLDDRTITSDIWLTPEQVDVFKDEVKKKKVRVPPEIVIRISVNLITRGQNLGTS